MGKRKKARNRKGSMALMMQTIISIVYAALLVHMTVLLVRSRTQGWFSTIIAYFPQLVIIISSMALQFVLRIRHRAHTQDGSLLPLLFTFIALESSMILPIYYDVSGISILPPSTIIFLSRFSLLSAAILFTFSAVQFFGTNLSKMWLYLISAIGASLFISIAIPLNTTSSSMIFTSSYDAYFLVLITLIYIAAAATYIAAVAKDRATHSVTRSAAFIFLIIGNYLSIGTDIVTGVLSVVIYVAGIIMLSISAKNTF